MKPGTLSSLNRNLCLSLQPDRIYVLTTGVPRLSVLTVSPLDSRPVLPTPCGQDRERAPDGPARRVRQGLQKVLLRTGFLALVVVINLGLLGFERVDRARERHLLGRAIADREQRARSLMEMNRHIAGVVRTQHALLQQRAAAADNVLARSAATRRPSLAGI